MKKKIKQIIAMCMLVALVIPTSIFGESKTTTTYKQALNNTQNYIANTLKSPTNNSIGGEWAVIAMARSTFNTPVSFYDNYSVNLQKRVKECRGVLHEKKYTEYSRVILAYTAIGKDPRNIGGYNMISKLSDFDKVIWQGINGPIWALIALDSGAYEIPNVSGVNKLTTRQSLIEEILGKECSGGGFTLSGTKADPDMTAMAIQAMAPYKNQPKVKAAIDRAVAVLSNLQQDDGTFISIKNSNSESCAQVIVALSALGIDAGKEAKFVKNGNSAVNGLLSFYVKGGGFSHVKNGTRDQMATEQATYALVAYDRFLNGKTSLYDMTDLNKVKKPSNATIVSAKSLKTKTVKVTWKKIANVKGYQIRYGTTSKMIGSKAIKVSKTSTCKVITGLKKGKTYYVKVRAYNYTGSGAPQYGAYSKTLKVRVK